MNLFSRTLAASLLSLAMMPLALAQDIDNAPGSYCVGAGGVLSVNTSGNVENKTASAVTGICPAERKVIGGSWATHFSARVWVMDQSASQNVCCRVLSRTPNGVVKTGAEVCSTGASTDDQSLDLPEIVEGYTFAHFFVRCSVPAIDGIKTSRILTVRTIQE